MEGKGSSRSPSNDPEKQMKIFGSAQSILTTLFSPFLVDRPHIRQPLLRRLRKRGSPKETDISDEGWGRGRGRGRRLHISLLTPRFLSTGVRCIKSYVS